MVEGCPRGEELSKSRGAWDREIVASAEPAQASERCGGHIRIPDLYVLDEISNAALCGSKFEGDGMRALRASAGAEDEVPK